MIIIISDGNLNSVLLVWLTWDAYLDNCSSKHNENTKHLIVLSRELPGA